MEYITLSCERNNHGVSLLTSGQSQAALVVFQEALTTIKRVANAANVEHADTPLPAYNQDNCHASGFSIQESCCCLALSQGDCYVYSRPLLILVHNQNSHNYDLRSSRPPCLTSPEDFDVLLSLYSAVILFNMALACHHIGRSCNKDSALKRAMVLYRMSTQLLLCCPSFPPLMMGDTTTPSILALLALNNRAQINYCEYCDYDQCRYCLKEMVRLMQMLNHDDYNNNVNNEQQQQQQQQISNNSNNNSMMTLQSALPENDLEGLLLNVMLLKTPSAAQAA